MDDALAAVLVDALCSTDELVADALETLSSVALLEVEALVSADALEALLSVSLEEASLDALAVVAELAVVAVVAVVLLPLLLEICVIVTSPVV